VGKLLREKLQKDHKPGKYRLPTAESKPGGTALKMMSFEAGDVEDI